MLCRIERESWDVVGVNGIADEAASGMSVQANHEEERQMMGIPERFEALVTNLVVCGRVHEQHNKEHKMTSDSSGLGEVNIQSGLLADL